MIIFKIIEQKMNDVRVECTKEDYLEDVERFEKPFLAYYQEWGLKNSATFVRILREKVVNRSKRLNDKYGNVLEKMQSQVVSAKDLEALVTIYNEAIAEQEVKSRIRYLVFTHYHVDQQIFKERIKVVTKFRKFVSNQISEKTVQEFARKESFALADGLIKMSHLYLTIMDEQTQQVFAPDRQEKVAERMRTIANQVQEDCSNFEELVREHSEDKATRFSGGDLDWIPRWTAPLLFGGFLLHTGWIPHRTSAVPEIVEIGYTLLPKKKSNVVKTRWGYHLLQVTRRKEGQKLGKEELQSRARNMLSVLKMEEMLAEWLKNSKIERHI